jgi:hypothetical protein
MLMTIQNQGLYELFCYLTKAGYELVSEKKEEPPLGLTAKKKIIQNEDGTLQITENFVPDYYRLVENYRTALSELSEFKAFDDLIKGDFVVKDYFGRAVGTPLMVNTYPVLEFIFFTISKILENEKDSSYDDMVKKIYSDLETLIYDREIPFVDIVPLDNFDSDVEHLDLDEGITLRKITNEEKEMLLGETLPVQMRIMSLKYVLQFDYLVKKLKGIFQYEDKAGTELVPQLIKQLRLFKTGSIGYSVIVGKVNLMLPIGQWYVKRDHKEVKEVILPDARPDAPVLPLCNLYILYRNEVTDLQTYRKLLEKISGTHNPKYDLAVRRFMYTYARELTEDKIIDFTISIESLFSKKGEGIDSISYKLSLRFCKLLQNNFEERRTLFKEIKSFYDLRSKIVHGDEQEQQEYLKKVDLKKIEDYLRTAFRQYAQRMIEQNLGHTQLIEILDFYN